MKRTLLHIAASFLLLVLPIASSAQTSVGINTATPNQNAVLELVSPGSNQGMLVPQLSTAKRISATFVASLSGKPANNGLLVYDKDLNSFFYWENTQWQPLLSKDLSRVVKAGNSTEGLTITGLSYPVASVDAANKGYVDDTVSRVIMQIENIQNIVNQHTTQINQLTDSIKIYSTYFNEYWDSIVNYHEHFNTIFDSIKVYNEHFTTLFDSIKVYNEHFTTLFDSIYSYSEHFTTIFDSIKVYNEHFTTIKESITKIEQTFEKAEFKLPQGEIYIGNTTGLAKTVPVTGDVLIDINGATAIQANTVTNGKLDKANIPLSGFGSPQADIDMATYKLTGLATPTNGDDAVNKSYSDATDTALSKRITDNKDNIALADAKMNTLRDSVKTNIANIGTLRDSVKTNITDIQANSIRIKQLSDTAVTQIALNAAKAKALRDSINYLYKTGKMSLANFSILMGGGDDTARAINFSTDDFTISDKIYIADEAIFPKHISGITTNGTAGEILVSKGNGTFEWQGKFAGGMSDDLQEGYFWVGNATDKASAVNKSAIPLSGFGAASADVTLGGYKLTNVLNPTANQDAATKKYVDDSLAVIRNTFKRSSFVLGHNMMYVGDANDTARAVSMNGHVAIVNETGKTQIQPGVIRASNLGASLTGTALGNGTLDHILTANGDGTFKWTDLSTKTVDPNNITLSAGKLFVGNVSNKAQEASKNTIPLSGFGAATADVALGGYKLTNVLNPTANQDAATKKYVDDSLAVHNTKIKTNATDIAGLTTKLNSSALSAGAVPYWNTTKMEDSKIWSNGSRIYIGAAKPGTFNYDCEINGSFKTQKIYHASDERWKKDIKILDSALTKVLMMNGVQYNWRRDEFPNKNFPTGLQIGLIAQQIEKIAPQLVTTDNEGYKAVEYANMVAFLIEAIKEQQKIIDAQQKEIKNNELKNASFEKRLEALENASAKKK